MNTPEHYRRFERLYAGVVYDAARFDLNLEQPFVVHPDLKPCFTDGTQVICGPAFTCLGAAVRTEGDIDDTVRIEMFRSFVPGCVQVIDTGADRCSAHFGDISGKLARKFGAIGAVIDGYTRDQRILREDDFPVFCRATLPTDAFGRWQITHYQIPVTLPAAQEPTQDRLPTEARTVAVHPFDTIYADSDGVLVIPREHSLAILQHAEERQRREDMVRSRLREAEDIQALYDEIGRW